MNIARSNIRNIFCTQKGLILLFDEDGFFFRNYIFDPREIGKPSNSFDQIKLLYFVSKVTRFDFQCQNSSEFSGNYFRFVISISSSN